MTIGRSRDPHRSTTTRLPFHPRAAVPHWAIFPEKVLKRSDGLLINWILRQHDHSVLAGKSAEAKGITGPSVFLSCQDLDQSARPC